jgi:NADPH:quinone reductase-like Zn-dependent oxidoreductase
VLSVEDVDELDLGHDEVLIRVRAAGVDPGLVVAFDRADLLTLRSLLEARGFAPVLDRRHQLEELPEALSRLEHGHARGMTVISL